MALHFLNGTEHKFRHPVTDDMMKQAILAAKTYEWTDNPEEVSGKQKEELLNNKDGVFPKQLVYKKTGIIATKTEEESHVLYVKGDVLTITSDEVIIQDIIT